MQRKALIVALLVTLLAVSLLALFKVLPCPAVACSSTEHVGGYAVDVVDLRGKDLKTRLLIISLQGIVNRDCPRLYVLWESKRVKPTASERWLEYYKSKGWISEYEVIGIWEAVRKYKGYVKGAVVYDPQLPATINLAVSLAGIRDLVVAHPDFVSKLAELGIEVKVDLRGKFKDYIEVHKWQLENVFPYCNKTLLFFFPTQRGVAIFRVALADYAIANRACSIGLSVERDAKLIGEYYKRMRKFAIVLGYPEHGRYERPWVELTSKYGLLNVLGTALSPNFSFHSKIPAKKKFVQDHRFNVALDESKIYIAFAATNLGLNSMQDFYYEMWLSKKRGEVPMSWWLDSIVVDFCPGIVQYYYETKTPNDYFYSAHVGGRIRASDFPYLEEYLKRGRWYLERCSLKVVAFSNHNKKDMEALKLYSKLLDNVEGFVFGFGPEFKEDYWLIGDKIWIVPRFVGKPEVAYSAIVKYIESKNKRPLFIVVGVLLGYYPTVEEVVKLRDMLKKRYGDQVVFCRLDELVCVVKQYALKQKRGEGGLKLILLEVVAIIALAVTIAALYYVYKHRRR